MDANANATVSSHTNLDCVWAEQRRPMFVPPHPTQTGGMAHFDSGVGIVSHVTTASYPHPANSMVGNYPSMNEVLSLTSPIKWKLMIG